MTSSIHAFLRLVVFAALPFYTQSASAHTPHDVIDGLELSPNYANDQTLFIIIEDKLLISTDGGNSWKKSVQGLDNKSALTSMAISPSFTKDHTLFVSSNGEGIYRSQDSGLTWGKINRGLENLNIRRLAVSDRFANRSMLFAADDKGGLYRSDDSGLTWKKVLEHGAAITAFQVVDRKEQPDIYLGDQRGVLLRSTDDGKSWRQVAEWKDQGPINAIASAPDVGQVLLVGTGNGNLFKSTNNGATFSPSTNELAGKSIQSIAFSPNFRDDRTIWLSTWRDAVYLSQDAGESWKQFSQGLTTDEQADSEPYLSPQFRELRVSRHPNQNSTLFLAGFAGLSKSTDGGRTWMQMETLPLKLIKGFAVSPGTTDSYTLAVSTYGGGMYLSADQGKSWSVHNRGLKLTRLADVAFSPNYASDHTLYTAILGALLVSRNSGDSWIELDQKDRSWQTRLSAWLIRWGAPTDYVKRYLPVPVSGTIYPTVISVSPNFQSDHTLFFGTRRHGLFRSRNGGKDSTVALGDLRGVVTSVILSPNYPSDGTAILGASGQGIFKTADGGKSWQSATGGLEAIFQNSRYTETPQEDLRLAISPAYKDDQTVYLGSSEGLFVSHDGARSWRELCISPGCQGKQILAVAVSPKYREDKTVWISVKGPGLLKSRDGGTTFIRSEPGLIDRHAIEFIAFSPNYAVDKTVYAASDEELFRSSDDGYSWELLKRPVRYENNRDAVYYEGSWAEVSGAAFSAMSVSQSQSAGSKATVRFVGTGASWLGNSSRHNGIARVYLDGKHQADVDQYSDADRPPIGLYSVADLVPGPHTLTVEVSGQRNPASSGTQIQIDAFDVYP